MSISYFRISWEEKGIFVCLWVFPKDWESKPSLKVREQSAIEINLFIVSIGCFDKSVKNGKLEIILFQKDWHFGCMDSSEFLIN